MVAFNVFSIFLKNYSIKSPAFEPFPYLLIYYPSYNPKAELLNFYYFSCFSLIELIVFILLSICCCRSFERERTWFADILSTCFDESVRLAWENAVELGSIVASLSRRSAYELEVGISLRNRFFLYLSVVIMFSY